jgi:hypothetical protein
MANKTVGFELKFEGFTELLKLNDELKEQKKILADLRKSQGANSEAYLKQAESVGKLQAEIKQKKLEQSKEIQEQRKANKEAERAAKLAEKEVGAYKKKSDRLNKLRNEYKNLAAAEKGTTEEALKLLKTVQKLDNELKQIDKTVGQSQRNVGNYESAFDGLGNILSGNVTGALAATGAGAAAVAAIEIGTEIATQVKEITDQFKNLRGEIGLLTDSSGEELDGFAVNISAIADTFGVDTNEILLAANSLTDNLTGDFSKSLELIEQGFLSGADVSGEFLNSVKEYPSFFGDAGVSGEKFIDIISQSTKTGVFSDKGVDAFKEAKLSLTELPQAAKDALTAIGISSTDIKKEIEENGVGSAISTVSKRLGELEKDSPEVGQALADIFKGAGEDAGVEFIIDSFSDMDVQMSSLIDTSNQLTREQQYLLEQNKGLSESTKDLTNALGESGVNFDGLLINVKTLAIDGLVDLIEIVKIVIDIFRPFFDLIGEIASSFEGFGAETEKTGSILEAALSPVERFKSGIQILADVAKVAADGIRQFLVFVGALDEKQEQANYTMSQTPLIMKDGVEQSKAYQGETAKLGDVFGRLEKEQEKVNTKTKDNTKATDKNTVSKRNNTKASKAKTQQTKAEEGSITDLTSKISALNSILNSTSDESLIAKTSKELFDLESQLETVKQKIEEAKLQTLKDTFGVSDTEATGLEGKDFSIINTNDLEQEKDEALSILDDYFAQSKEAYNEFRESEGEKSSEQLKADFQNEKLFFNKRFDALKELFENGEISLKEFKESSKLLLGEIADFVGNSATIAIDTIGSIYAAQQAKETAVFDEKQMQQTESLDNRLEQDLAKYEGNEEKQAEITEKYNEDKKVLDEKLALEKEEIERKFAKKQQRLAIANAIINGAVGIVKTGSNLGYPLAIPFQIAQGIQTVAQIAAINAQQFAEGGKVGASNIPMLPNGDSVLATLMPDEVVLTKANQKALGGDETFRQIGVKGFGSPRTVSVPSVSPRINTNFATQSNVNQQSNELILRSIAATNNRIDRIKVVANAKDIVKMGNEKNEKAKKLEI